MANPFPTFPTTLIDDDGVLVVASEVALRKRYATRKFDYRFPNALLEGMGVGELFAWHTGFEGEHTVHVEVGQQLVDDETQCTPAHTLIITEGDALLVLPYSSFTLGCDNAATFDLRDGLGTRVAIPASTYRIRVMRAAQGDDGSFFRVLLSPDPSVHPMALRDIPGWPD